MHIFNQKPSVKQKKRNIEYLERWIINNKPNNLKVELPEIDLSGSSATEKIIYLHKLGVIDYLKSKQPFLSSTNSLATILSAIIDEKPGTIQSMINPILSKKVDEKNNPLNSPKPVAKVIKQLNDIGFNLNKTIQGNPKITLIFICALIIKQVQMKTQIFLNGITIQELAETLIPLLQTQNTAITQSENELMTRDEVCKMLSFNKTSLWKHTRSGKLKSYAIGNRVLYKRTEILESLTHLKK